MNTHTTTIPRQTLLDALSVADLDEDALYEGYSGRGMYGAECFGFTCTLREFAIVCAALGSTADDWDFVGKVQTDSMGLGQIFYFPGVGISEED